MTTSLSSLQRDLDEIKPLLKEILEKVEDMRNITEAAAAKIISEMKKCPCNKEVLEILNSRNQTILIEGKTEENYSKLQKYSYPNNSVGNEELGTGKNPNSITWPPSK